MKDTPMAEAETKSAHTAGEWTAQKCADGFYDDWSVLSPSGLAVAAVIQNGGPGQIDAAQAEANARLIAAAPTLLEALKALESVARYGMTAPFIQGELEDARAAIAKAEGAS